MKCFDRGDLDIGVGELDGLEEQRQEVGELGGDDGGRHVAKDV